MVNKIISGYCRISGGMLSARFSFIRTTQEHLIVIVKTAAAYRRQSQI